MYKSDIHDRKHWCKIEDDNKVENCQEMKYVHLCVGNQKAGSNEPSMVLD